MKVLRIAKLYDKNSKLRGSRKNELSIEKDDKAKNDKTCSIEDALS